MVNNIVNSCLSTQARINSARGMIPLRPESCGDPGERADVFLEVAAILGLGGSGSLNKTLP
jgi:hypothetical protein